MPDTAGSDATNGEEQPRQEVFSTGLGQGIGIFDAQKALTIEDVIARYGIGVWHDRGFRDVGQKVAVLDTAFGGLTTLS